MNGYPRLYIGKAAQELKKRIQFPVYQVTKETLSEFIEYYSTIPVMKFPLVIEDFIKDKLYNSDLILGSDIDIVKIQLHGSRLRGQAKVNSDLDAVVQYLGDIREDSLFDILNEEPLYIDDVLVDINPIKEDMKSYMKRSDDYDKQKLGL